jgi:DNA invertase Pin-like site-specific DNA recombinase
MAARKKSEPSAGYVAYYRVSTQRQGESGLGLGAQREAVARLAKTGPILAEYTEVESGKSHNNRPQLLAALAEAKRRKATLLIAKLDRLARNVHFISGLMEAGVDFQAADMPHANRLTIHILAAMAEHERELISQRTKAGLEAAIREIEQNGSRISNRSRLAGTPRSYSKHGNPRWQESIEKARAARIISNSAPEIITRINELRRQKVSLRDIAKRFNDAGIRTKTGAVWYASTVRAAILESEAAATQLLPVAA